MIDLKIAEPLIWPNNGTRYSLITNSLTKRRQNPREADYNQFASEKSEKTLSVFYSEELYYAVVHGFKPLPAAGSRLKKFTKSQTGFKDHHLSGNGRHSETACH